MSAKGPLLALERLRVERADGRVVLDGVDLAVEPGERIAITGANGAGKTTLLRTIVGLQRPVAGTIWAFGRPRARPRDFHEVRLRAGLLFQNSDDQLFSPTVREDVAFGPRNQGLSADEANVRADEVLATLGLDGFGGRVTHRLSGGEQRLVALATVLAMRPEVLLLDEPTAGLDEDAERRLVEILDGLPQAQLVVSHERGLIERLRLAELRLADGRLHPA